MAYREKFLCRQCHPNYGDCFHFAAWLNDYNLNTRTGMEAAADWLTNGNPPMVAGACSPKPTTPRPRPILTPPAECWQQRAADFVAYAQEQLWAEPGRVGLDYLLGRGLSEETIKAAGLGFNPKDYNDPAHKWGVSGRDSIWLPGPGIVIPWAIDNSLHRVNIRLLKPRQIRRKTGKTETIKYIGPAGWQGANPLYNADDITPHKPVLLVEGELCALTAGQEGGELITAAATGAKDSARGGRWIARLAAAPLVLLAFDAEPGKGDAAATRWAELLPNARRWRPLLKDVNDMHRAGVSVCQWIEAALPAESRRDSGSPVVPFTLYFDGANSQEQPSYGWHINDATGNTAKEGYGLGGATSNQAEYHGLIAGLKAAVDLSPVRLEVCGDSRLVINQVVGKWKVNDANLSKLHREACALAAKLPGVSFRWIARKENKQADKLSRLALTAPEPFKVITWPNDTPAVALPRYVLLADGRFKTEYHTEAEFRDSVHTLMLIKEAVALGGVVVGVV